MSKSHTTEQPAPELSFFQQRMQLLGIEPELNKILIWQHEVLSSSPDYGKNVLKPFPIFEETKDGIDILVYHLNRTFCRYAKKDERNKNHIYKITRLEIPKTKPNGDEAKYLMPKGQPTMPFFPPWLVAKYDECCKWLTENPGQKLPAKLVIKTLYITEGYFKAFKAQMHGIDCVGVPSITCLRDTTTNELHSDIQTLIIKGGVERVVWLTDGDCRNITSKEIADGADLYKRPNQFFGTVNTFYHLMSKFDDVQKFFAHVNTDDLATWEDGRIVAEGPKGLDDLLIQYPDEQKAIVKEFNDFSKLGTNTAPAGHYLRRINISYNIGRVLEYFLLKDVTQFYLFHSERRPDLKTIKNFKFNGTLYRYDAEKGICEIEIPKAASDYIRMGNDYYQHIQVPNKYGQVYSVLAGRQKSTILDDNGKDIFKHIMKYDAPCVVPNHLNYQSVINNCYNLYKPFIHTPEEGDCEKTLDFVKHIFGTDVVTYEDKGVTVSVSSFELGLDYLTILYKYPQRILPILCLVSRDRQTGKTTFINWLDKVFAENVITIGNEDMEADFNAHWVSKLIVACDETKLDKHVVIQKIKRLSTADKIVMNSKGKDQVILEFFAKFILISNDEEDFIKIDKEENRFWVKRVPKLATVNNRLLEDLIDKDEIAAFLHFLDKRTMATVDKERHWFDTRLLQSEALDLVKANSLTGLEKRIVIEITELFELSDNSVTRLTLPLSYIAELLRQPDKNFVAKTLHKMGFKAQASGRVFYPVKEKVTDTNGFGIKLIPTTWHGRYYEFMREDYITGTMASTVEIDMPAAAVVEQDLPF